MLKQQTYPSGKKKKKNRKNKMVSVRFSCLLIVLLLTVCHSIARPYQVQGESRVISGQKIFGEGEIILHQGSSSETTVHARRCRKLMENRSNRTEEEEELKETDSNGENDRELSSNSANIRILKGINGLRNKNNKRSKDSNSKHHHSIKKRSLKKNHSHLPMVKSLIPEELDTDSSSNDFVAFSADYGHPRHHPPKNN